VGSSTAGRNGEVKQKRETRRIAILQAGEKKKRRSSRPANRKKKVCSSSLLASKKKQGRDESAHEERGEGRETGPTISSCKEKKGVTVSKVKKREKRIGHTLRSPGKKRKKRTLL